MLSCKEVAVLLSQDLDHELPWLRRLRLRCHLLICQACRRLRAQLELQREAARQTPLPITPLPAAARDRIKDMLRKNDGRQV